MPRGHQEVSPVSQPHATEAVGNLEDDPGEDTRAEEPHLLTWKDNERTEEPSDWSRSEAMPDEEGLMTHLPSTL